MTASFSQAADLQPLPSVAVAYLLRGTGPDWQDSADRFFASYAKHRAGVAHDAYVILKGFADDAALSAVQRRYEAEGFGTICLNDDGFDIMAYRRWACDISAKFICVFNSHSEILADNWLRKFMLNLTRNNVAMVSATASFESLCSLFSQFRRFPNPHLRSNSLCLERELFLYLTEGLTITEKLDAFRFESGEKGITARLLEMNRQVAVVGSDGRAFAPRWWPFSGTYRQGNQENLMVADNVTRAYAEASFLDKRRLSGLTWGAYLNEDWPLSQP